MCGLSMENPGQSRELQINQEKMEIQGSLGRISAKNPSNNGVMLRTLWKQLYFSSISSTSTTTTIATTTTTAFFRCRPPKFSNKKFGCLAARWLWATTYTRWRHMNGCTGQVAPVLLPLSLQKITNKPVIEASNWSASTGRLRQKKRLQCWASGVSVFRRWWSICSFFVSLLLFRLWSSGLVLFNGVL